MKLLLVYRLKDPFGNKSTLSVGLNSDDSLRYSFYGSWQPSGTPFAISNMQLEKELPMFMGDFTIKTLGYHITRVLNSGVNSISHLITNEKEKKNGKI